MLSETVLLLVYVGLIVILTVLNFVPVISSTFGLYKVQKAFLLASSFLFIVLFYFLRSFIIEEDGSYIILIAILYTIWYYLTKIIVNKIMGYNVKLNNLI